MTRMWIEWAGRLAFGCTAKFSFSGLRFIPAPGILPAVVQLAIDKKSRTGIALLAAKQVNADQTRKENPRRFAFMDRWRMEGGA